MHVTRFSNPIGEHTWYRKDGSIEKILNYKAMKLNGLKTIFNESGLRKIVLNYKPKSAFNDSGSNYSLDGTTIKWHDNGIKSYEGSFRSIKVPKTQYNHDAYYYPRSKIDRFSNRSGKSIWFNEAGTASEVQNYVKNKLVGLRTKFLDNGRKKIELNYKPKSAFNDSGSNYSLDGTTIKWHDNGIKSYEGSFRSIKVPETRYNHDAYYYPKSKIDRFSNPVGEHTWWQKNGSLKDKKDYKKGK
jgi:antitoxin component YwqK of YwqJK toxin-antitoxin module